MRGVTRFSQEDIEQMIFLKESGYTNRQIAEIFKVAKSTVWDNIYSNKNTKIVLPQFRKVQIAIEVIRIRKEQGKNTQEVSKELDIPLGEVNYIWGTIHLKESVV